MGTYVARRSRRQVVGNFPRLLIWLDSLSGRWGSGRKGGDMFGGFRLLLGMLLCVGCLVSETYPTGF